MTVFLGNLWSSIKELKTPFLFQLEHGIVLTQCQGFRPHLAARGKSHGFSRVASGTWDIFSHDGVDVPSKVVSVQRHQDSCLLVRDSSGFSSRLGRAIGMPIEVRRETQGLFPVAKGIWGFLSIINSSQTSSPFELLNSVCFSRCQSDMCPPLSRCRGDLGLCLTSPQGIPTSLHLVG